MASQKLMALVVLTMLILLPASSAEVTELDKYLDCLTDKKVDIVFVFDTTGSMEGEINELSAIARNFASDLETSRLDYRLGLVEFRDFPQNCGGGDKATCGSPGDFPYKLKGNGSLTANVSTFNSWVRELKTGGGSGPEAVLAALRYAVSNCQWRSDAGKVMIVLTDAGPHPDGDCCNAEGDTLDGTIFGLTEEAARVHVIGPDDPALKKIAGDTGGQFYKIRSGLSLKPLLKEISGAMSCSFQVDVEASCENRVLKAKVQLVGKEAIPYVAGQTEAWMYLDLVGNRSRYNLSYDQATEAYLGEVLDVCGPVDLTVYGRVGERSAVQTVQQDCGTCGAVAGAMQGALSISGRVFDDSNGDGVKGTDEAGLVGWDVLLDRPDGNSFTMKTDRKGYYIFTGLLPGSYGLGAVAQGNWTATVPAEGIQAAELVDTHESEIDFGFKSNKTETRPSEMIEQFNRTFGGAANDYATSVQPISDGSYILAGRTHSLGGYFNDAWLIKADSQGHEIWNRTFGISAGWDGKYSVQPTDDGGYILAGTCYSLKSGNFDNSEFNESGFVCLIKTDPQGYEIWNKTFAGADSWSGGISLQPATDGGYILAGCKKGKDDPYIPFLIKIDSQGNEIWERIFEDDIFDLGGLYGLGGAYSAQPTTDGGYILTGYFEGQMGSNGWLIKTDSEGHEIWGRNFVDSKGQNNAINQVSRQVAYSMQPTSDGGYILAGQRTYSDENGNLGIKSEIDAWLIKVDAEGNELWNRTLKENNSCDYKSVQPTIDGGYILAGSTNWTLSRNNEFWGDALLVKTDIDGNVVWSKTFGGVKNDYATSVQQTSDGGYILVGLTESFGAGMYDAWLLKVDSEGNIVQLPKKAG